MFVSHSLINVNCLRIAAAKLFVLKSNKFGFQCFAGSGEVGCFEIVYKSFPKVLFFGWFVAVVVRIRFHDVYFKMMGKHHSRLKALSNHRGTYWQIVGGKIRRKLAQDFRSKQLSYFMHSYEKKTKS